MTIMAMNVTLFQLASWLAIALLAGAIYRVYLSPLAKFPGPKLAALTSWYEGYYDCIKNGGGRYYVEISKMHDKYGPVVRINPWELHIRDADWNEVYKITRRASKDMWYYRFLGPPGNVFTSDSADLHRARREAIGPYFSPAAIARHQPEVERLVRKMLARLAEFKGKTDGIVRLDDVFRAFATDGATAFAFRTPFGHLDSPDFERRGNAAVRKFGTLGMINRHFRGWVVWFMKEIVPPSLAIKISPASLGVSGFFKQLDIAVRRGFDSSKKLAGLGETETDLVRQILNSSLPPEEKTVWRVTRESSGVTLAGTETTGSVLTVMVYHLLAQPEKAEKLREELKEAYQKYERPPTYQELKELPYLAGVISEGLRMDSVAGRLPRYDPKQNMMYRDRVIPKGTVVSTTQNDTHFNPVIFPEPDDFLPERWLDEVERKRMAKYWAPFGRGARSCIGMEISLMEMYLALGRLFSPEVGFRLELHGTNYQRDVAMFHDYFSPFPKSDRGVRALVKG